MTQYKIIYDRSNCIGVSSCALLAEKFWKMAKDAKADLIGATQTAPGIWELEIDGKEIEQNKEAARNCPVAVIKIFDKDGKEISP